MNRLVVLVLILILTIFQKCSGKIQQHQCLTFTIQHLESFEEPVRYLEAHQHLAHQQLQYTDQR
jgi:hypothetical protein